VTDNTYEQMLKIPKAGGPMAVIAKAGPTPWGIAVDGSCVYWTDHEGRVMRTAKDPASF
jgi:hypothetical protein